MTRVVVYVQAGCPACHEYTPRIRAAARKYRVALDVVHLDTRSGAAMATKHRIRVTPTTDFFSERDTVTRRTGNLPDAALERLLAIRET